MKTRKEASILLNVSIPTLIRMEKYGILTPIKYCGENSKVFYREDELVSIMSCGTSSDQGQNSQEPKN